MADKIDRRDLIKISAGAVVAARLAEAAGGHQFFTDAEYSTVNELTEMIIPTDDHSPGAKAAKVADYIDRVLAEAFEQEERNDFREGLKPYIEATNEQRLAMLTKASGHDHERHHNRHAHASFANLSSSVKFFRLLKEHTIRGYYTSSIGIHQDMDYKGNVYQTGEYAGYLPS